MLGINPSILILLGVAVMVALYLIKKNWNAVYQVMRLAFFLVPLATLCAGFYMMAKDPEVIVKRINIPVPMGKEELTELLEEIPRAYGIPEIMAEAVVEQESGGKMESIRYEPGQLKLTYKLSKDPTQQRMLASSHCAMQVMGYHAPALGIKWSDLYDPRTCVETGMKILADCKAKSKSKTKYGRYFDALTCYNGSEKYARKVMEAIGKKLIEEGL